LLIGFPILQQLRIKPQTGIDQEDAVIEHAHLYGSALRLQQDFRGFGCIGRNAVGTAKVVEGALWQDAEGAPAVPGALRDRIQRTVAAACNDDPVMLLSPL